MKAAIIFVRKPTARASPNQISLCHNNDHYRNNQHGWNETQSLNRIKKRPGIEQFGEACKGHQPSQEYSHKVEKKILSSEAQSFILF